MGVTTPCYSGCVYKLADGGTQHLPKAVWGLSCWAFCLSPNNGRFLPLQKHTEEITKMRNDFERQVRGQCHRYMLWVMVPGPLPSESSLPAGLVVTGFLKQLKAAQLCSQGTL